MFVQNVSKTKKVLSFRNECILCDKLEKCNKKEDGSRKKLSKAERAVLDFVILRIDSRKRRTYFQGKLTRFFSVSKRNGGMSIKVADYKKIVSNGIEKMFVRINQSEMADALNLTRETINRSLKSLKENGLIECLKLGKLRIDHTKYYSLGDDFYRRAFSTIAVNNPVGKPVGKAKNSQKCHNQKEINFMNKINNNKSRGQAPESIFRKEIQRDASTWRIRASNNPAVVAMSSEREPTTPSVREMLSVADEVLGRKISAIKMTKERARMLGAARNQFFMTLELWRKFLTTIKNSWFFMRKKFDLTLEWLLSFRTLHKILFLGVGISKTIRKAHCDFWQKKLDEERDNRKIFDALWACDNIEAKDEPEEMKNLRRAIVRKFGVGKYRTYFANSFMFKRGSVVTIYHDLSILGALSEKFGEFFAKHGLWIEEKEKWIIQK